MDRCSSFLPFQITCVVRISPDTMLVSSGSTHSVHLTPTPNSIHLLTLNATTLLSPKSCHWPQLYQAVISHQNLGQVIIPLGGPVQMSLRSVNLLLSISIFLYICFTSSKTSSFFKKFTSLFTLLVD